MDTPEENEVLKNLLQDLGYNRYSFWIGLSDVVKEGTNVWEDTGSLLNYEDWGDDYGETEEQDCKYLNSYDVDHQYEFHWANYPCSNTKNAICEFPAA